MIETTGLADPGAILRGLRHAENLLRIKGVVRFADGGMPHLINGVHDVYSILEMPPLTLAAGLVVIGQNLPATAIAAEIANCQVSDTTKTTETTRRDISQARERAP